MEEKKDRAHVPEALEETEELHHIPDAFKFIDRVNQFLLLSGWTYQRLAQAAGISTSALSQFMANKYRGNVDNVRLKLANIIEREKEKASLKTANPNFIETSVSRRVFDIASLCRMFCEIGVCFADAGVGKTEAVREFAAQKPDVILIEADPGYTASALINEIHDKLGNGSRHNLHGTLVECIGRLQNSGRLLIIDEAEQLPYKALELVRRLHDKANIGVLLTGMPKLLPNLCGYKGEYTQLYSRVGFPAKLEPLTKKDTELIVSRLIGDTNGLWRVFHKESEGNARRLFKMIKRTIHISDVNNIPLDTEAIKIASKMFKVEAMYG